MIIRQRLWRLLYWAGVGDLILDRYICKKLKERTHSMRFTKKS